LVLSEIAIIVINNMTKIIVTKIIKIRIKISILNSLKKDVYIKILKDGTVKKYIIP
jgi:hypothetical protein